MSHTPVEFTRSGAWARRVALVAMAIAASLFAAACGSDDDSSGRTSSDGSSSGGSKLVVMALPFPCNLNNFAKDLCDGARAGAEELSDGYELQIKTASNYNDQASFNNLIQTSLQLNPAGMLVFANGAAAQAPFLNQGCDRGLKVIWVDTAGEGVRCQVSFVTAANRKMGEEAGRYLIDHPPANGSREVIIVSQQPGLFNSNDERVAGFKETVEAAGFEVVQTVTTTNDLTQTRTAVTNALTAHPDAGAVFSANGPMGNGTEQALRKHPDVMQITMDGNATDIPSIIRGSVAANVAQSPYQDSKVAMELIVRAIEGEQVPRDVGTPIKVIDRGNAKAYLEDGGSLR